MGGRFERGERLEHQTLGVQRLAVRSEDYWDYKPDQRVQTIDGVTGVVKHVEDGPFPGWEEYEVELDHGMGGGKYTASQLSPAPITAEAMEQTAAADYPELAEILVERPDPALQHVTAAKAAPFGDDDEQDDTDSDDDSEDDGDSDDDSQSSDDDSDSNDSDDDGDDSAPPWAKKASALFSDLVVMAAADGDFRFHVTAAWRDVVEKAKRIRSEGRLRVTMASDGLVFAEVKGDHEVYETGLQRMPGKMAAHSWSCGCKWGAYHWGADDDFSRFAGRMCSHALALQYEAQSRGMFGRDVHADEHKPSWVPRKVVVRYDIDADQHRLAPATAARREASVNPHGLFLRFGDWSHDERSNNNLTGGKEDGVSVYDLDHKGHPMDPDPEGETDHWPLEEMHGRVGKAEVDRKFGGDRPDRRAHLVRGDVWGFGADNEPLLKNVERVGDWMDHRHLFLPDSKPHPLARREDHEEYEPPEVPPSHGRTAAFDAAPLSTVARAAMAAGEDQEELLLALSAAGIRPLANANAPFGEPSGTSYVLPKTPGATAPKKPWENPASAGPLAGADPVGWNRQLPLQSYAHAGLESALFEPGGTEAELHEEPEGALPSTDGSVPTDEASDLTPSMTAGLKRQALKDFTLAEQQSLINEGEGVRAANLDRLDIKGTHYADLESVLAAQEEDTTWLA